MVPRFELSRALGLTAAPGQPVEPGAIKAQLTQRGVNARGWRLYLDHGDIMFKPLARVFGQASPSDQAAQALAWLCVLQACEMDVLPPAELVRSMAQWCLPQNQLSAIPPMFLRAAWKATVAAAYQGSPNAPANFVAKEVVPFAQWFFSSGAYKTTRPDSLKVGWGNLGRLRREFIRQQGCAMSGADWPPVVQKYSSGPYVLLGLCRETELQEEGEAMDHCVDTYGDTCRFEPLRIFSIRLKKTGARVATLSVKETKPGWWDVDQLKGPSNADPGTLMWMEIVGLLQTLNTVSSHDAELRQYLDSVRQLGAAS